MLKNTVIADLKANPWGLPISLTEAATALDVGEAQVQNYINNGTLKGARFEDGRVVSISRISIRQALGLA